MRISALSNISYRAKAQDKILEQKWNHIDFFHILHDSTVKDDFGIEKDVAAIIVDRSNTIVYINEEFNFD